MNKYYLFSLMFLCLFLGCAPQISQQQLNRLIGYPIYEVIDGVGPPHRVTPDGRGGEIYIWEETKSFAYTHNDILGVPLKSPLTTVHSKKTYVYIFVDKDGTIYNAKTGKE